MKTTLIIWMLLCCGVTVSVAQSPRNVDSITGSRFGLEAAFIRTFHSADFRALPGVPNCCPQFGSGTGNGFAIQGVYEHPLSSGISAGVRIGYTSFNGALEATETTTIGVNGVPVQGVFVHSMKGRLGMFTAEGLVSYSPFARLQLFGGAGGGSILQRHYEQQELLKEPSDVGTFENGRRTRNESSGEIPEIARMQAWGTAGIGYEIPLGPQKRWVARPELIGRLGVTDLVKGLQWKISTVTAGVAILYLPFSATADVLTPVEPAHIPLLQATITAMGVNPPKNTEDPIATIRVEEFLTTYMRPLLNYVFFDEGSAMLPDRYRRLTQQQMEVFRLESLDTAAMPTYHDMLNIVGLRMREHPDAQITITGCNAGNEAGDMSLSRQRAEAVRDYLYRVWNVSLDRMSIAARRLPVKPSNTGDPDGVEENRRVEITSDSFAILSPVITHDTLRTMTPPVIRFFPKNESQATIARWEISAEQGGSMLTRIHNVGNLPPSRDWRIQDEPNSIPRASEALLYKLSIYDSTSRRFTTQDKSLSVEQRTIRKKKIEQINDTAYAHYSLILFDFNTAELTDAQRRILDIIQTDLDSTAQLSIIGYTDRMGDDDYNARLSINRARTVAQALGLPVVTTTGEGEGKPLYDNNVPEGRFYNRTVEINAKVPVRK